MKRQATDGQASELHDMRKLTYQRSLFPCTQESAGEISKDGDRRQYCTIQKKKKLTKRWQPKWLHIILLLLLYHTEASLRKSLLCHDVCFCHGKRQRPTVSDWWSMGQMKHGAVKKTLGLNYTFWRGGWDIKAHPKALLKHLMRSDPISLQTVILCGIQKGGLRRVDWQKDECKEENK